MSKLLDSVTATGAGNGIKNEDYSTFQAVLTGTGAAAISCTVEIEVSNVNSSNDKHWVNAGTITLAVAAWATTADDIADGFFATEAKSWSFVRANLTSLDANGGVVSVYIGE